LLHGQQRLTRLQTGTAGCPQSLKNNRKTPFPARFRIAMFGPCHYNAHAIYRPAWKYQNHMRHKPPVSPMDVAFLVPEASELLDP